MGVLNEQSSPIRLYLLIFNIISVMFLCIIPIFQTSVTYANASTYLGVAPCQNSPQPPPDSRSLLVVLLDRSGSLVATPPNGTDPDLYSTSVTRALADLWPGKMAVVAFNTSNASGSEQVQLTVIGPLQVGDDLAHRTELKNEIQKLPTPNLGTPTGPAMDKALEIIRNEGAPLSRMVLITDGSPGYLSSDPNGTNEENHINNDLLQQLCAASVPVDTVGLKTDQAANTFLSGISTGTNGMFQSVTDPRDLSNAVLSLDGQWQRNRDYKLLQLQSDNTYHKTIGELDRTLHLFVFRSNDSYKVTIKDPNGGQLNTQEDATDKHYVTETLNFPTPTLTGDYTISVSDANGTFDTGALVYAFVDSNLQVQLLTPTATTQVPIQQFFSMQVQLLVDQKPLQRLQGKAVITAYVTYTISGQRHTEPPVTLLQQGQQNLFIGQIRAPAQPVPLHIEVIANYEGVPAETDITTQMVCGLSVPCLVQQYWIPLLISLPILLFLLAVLAAWLIWRQQPAPFGILSTVPSPRRRRRVDDDDDDEASVALARVEATHPLMQRIFHRSILTSGDIQNHRDAKGNFDFDFAGFDLVFMKGGVVELVSTSIEPIIIKHGSGSAEELDQGKSIQLETEDIITVAAKDRAIFSK